MKKYDVIGTIVGVTALVLSLLIYYFFSLFSCMNSGRLMKMATRYDVLSGCMIQHKEGYFIPLKQYRVIE